jgi:hypothetical protein
LERGEKILEFFAIIVIIRPIRSIEMQTITLKIEDSVSEKFLWLLNHFNPKEIEILEKTTYQSDDEYLKSIEGMEKSIIETSQEPIENYVSRNELDW